MDTNRITTCIISLSALSETVQGLKRIIGSSQNPSLYLSNKNIWLSGSPTFEKSLKTVNCHWPGLVFIVLSAHNLEQAGELIHSIKKSYPKIKILVLFEDPTSEAIIALLRQGAGDVIGPPFLEANVIPRIWRILNCDKNPDEALLDLLKCNLGMRKLIGRNALFLSEVQKIPLIARCDTHVLISGQTGTGKEIFARSIHYLSRRAAYPFVAISCGAIPAELFENELFGHERGAFTGAVMQQSGLIREAEGGSLFFDDIDCVPPSVQAKMLRFLQEKEFKPLGSAQTLHSDTRIIASTNIDLSKPDASTAFRRDLYYRLNVISIHLPPLRDRADDIPLLAKYFIEKHGAKINRAVKNITQDALIKLSQYDWPGNVRELENVIERAVVFASKPIIEATDIDLPEEANQCDHLSFKVAKARAIAQFEKAYIHGLLATHEGNITQSAIAAQKDRRAFWELIRKHRIDPQSYKTKQC